MAPDSMSDPTPFGNPLDTIYGYRTAHLKTCAEKDSDLQHISDLSRQSTIGARNIKRQTALHILLGLTCDNDGLDKSQLPLMYSCGMKDDSAGDSNILPPVMGAVGSAAVRVA
eukprot:m.413118 g.413118  ORF g.413118 m.413118 type:complete len:113 (-) comp21262_c0_seq11:8-346(-)